MSFCGGHLLFVCSYWHVESEPVFEHTPVADPLPSDSRFREDVIALKVGSRPCWLAFDSLFTIAWLFVGMVL